jgi:hypothetical protein
MVLKTKNMSYWIVQYMKNCVIIYLTMLVCIIISLCLCLMQINLYFYLLMRICVIILTKSAMRFQWEENTFSIDNFSYVHIIVYILTIVFLVRVARVCFYSVCLLYSLWDFNKVFVLSCLVLSSIEIYHVLFLVSCFLYTIFFTADFFKVCSVTRFHTIWIFIIVPYLGWCGWIVAFNATFNNISVISLRKPEYPEKTTDLSQVTD